MRTARIRRGWRQADLAAAAGISRSTIARVEHGRLDELSLGTLRSIGEALEVGVEILPRSRGAQLDGLLGARHAALAEAMVDRLRRMDGWVVRPEVSFSIYGERGVVDLVAWHAASRALLVIELKTAIVDIGEILGTFDRKVRLAREIARGLGWEAATVSACLIVGHSSTNRRRVAEHRSVFRAALPDDGRSLRHWLARPNDAVHAVRGLRALVFVSDDRPRSIRSGFASPIRVSTRQPRSGRARPCSKPVG